MGIKKSIFGILNSRYGMTIRKHTVHAVGQRKYVVVNDSLRTDDYDDAWTLAISRRSKVIFDVGSNMGQAALLMMYFGNVDEIYLIDPNPEALSIAAENFIRNNLSSKAHFIPSFASDVADKTVDFYTEGAGAAGSVYKKHAKSAAASDLHYAVPTTTVDKLTEFFKVNPDFIKVDVEGAEMMVLRGCVETVKRCKPKLLVEMHSNPDLPMQQNASMLLDWCRNAGYTAWYMKHGTKLDTADSVANRGRFHVFLLPEGAPYPDYLVKLGQSSTIEAAISA